MLKVFHLGMSQSERVVWLCEELEIVYELICYERDPITRLAPAEYKALHPFGTAPVIKDGELTLAESGAIIEYLIARHGNGRLAVTSDSPAFPDYLFWFHFANGSMMPIAIADLVIGTLGREENDITRALQARGDKAFAMVEARLSRCSYFAGSEFSAADIIMFFPLTTMRLFTPRDMSPYPNTLAYLQRVGQRQAYQRAMRKAEPDLLPLLA